TVTFSQVAPGRYESEFVPTEQGIYLIHFSGKTDAGDESSSFAETTGWALSYSPEYQRINPDPDLLLRLSALGNGQVASPLPADIFAHNLKATRASQPIAPLLLLIAALLLPFDIAVRRLIITRHDVGLLREWFNQKFVSRIANPTYKPEANPQMEALFNAKSRVRESKNTSAREMPIETEPTPSVEKEAQAVHPKPEQSTSTTSALLARKKNIRK
ncbi:MAG: hypothetical protein Q7T89_04715, partial [Anaerolineales bacterium]|nr:hypothetical protein [Anaerolineales bacterium]